MRPISRRLGPALTGYQLYIDADREAVDAVMLIVTPLRLPAERETWTAYIRFLRYVQTKSANAANALSTAEENLRLTPARPPASRVWYLLTDVFGTAAKVYGSGVILDALGRKLQLS